MQYLVFILGIALSALVIMLFHRFGRKYNKIVGAIVASFAVALLLEAFTFNFNSYEHIGNDSQLRNYNIDLSLVTNETVLTGDNNEIITASKTIENNCQKYTITIDNIYTVVKDIDVIPATNSDVLDCELQYIDDARSDFTYVDCEKQKIVLGVESTQHIQPKFAGKTHALKFIIDTEDNRIVRFVNIKLNENKPFDFMFYRFLAVFLIILAAMIIRMNWNKEIRIKAESNSLWAVILAFIIFEMAFGMFLSNGAGEVKHVLLDKGCQKDVYQELTQAISLGKVDLNNLNPDTMTVEQEQINALLKLQNPYEWQQRDGMEYKWDRAFYDGKYYCYFGIVPVLTVYLPIYLVTGKYLNTAVFVRGLFFVALLLISSLVCQIARRRRKKINIWMLLAAMLGFANCSMIVYCINGGAMYEVASLSAMVMAMAGINLLYGAFENKRKKLMLGLGALMMALSVGCRPNYIFASFIIVPIVLNGLAKQGEASVKECSENKVILYLKKIFAKENIIDIATLAIPYVVVGVGLMVYNYVRFDSVFEFGARYQLTVYDTKYYSLFDLGKLPIAIYKGLLELPKYISTFPFVKIDISRTNYLGYFYKLQTVGLLTFPFMWMVIMLPWSIKRGVNKMKDKGFVIMSMLTGLLACWVTTSQGGASLRYSADFAWMLCIPVIYVLFDLYDAAKNKGILKYMFNILLVVVVATVLVNSLMAISPDWSDMIEEKPKWYYLIQQMIVFWR